MRYVIVGLMSLVLCQPPLAWAHSEGAVVCQRTYTPIVVDGKLDDWVRRIEQNNWSGQLEVKKGKTARWMRAAPAYVNTISSRVEAGAVTSPEDFSAVVYTLWDDHNLYLAAVVTDDQVVTQHDGENIWQDDTMEVWLDCRHNAVTHTLSQDDEYQLGFSPASKYRNKAVAWAWRNPAAAEVVSAMQVASSSTPTGYIIEAAIPWRVLHGAHPAIGGMMGFNISFVDKDEDQQWTHITWSGQLHSDPSQFGHLYFVDAPIDLFPADVFESAPGSAPWEVAPESAQ